MLNGCGTTGMGSSFPFTVLVHGIFDHAASITPGEANRIQIPGQTTPMVDGVEPIAIPKIANDPDSWSAWSAAAWLKRVAHKEQDCQWDDSAEYTIKDTKYFAPAKKYKGDVLEWAIRSIKGAKLGRKGGKAAKKNPVLIKVAKKIVGECGLECSLQETLDWIEDNRETLAELWVGSENWLVHRNRDDLYKSKIQWHEGDDPDSKSISAHQFFTAYIKDEKNRRSP
jgi:hypothetical protein